jgi:hypothetical protein
MTAFSSGRTSASAVPPALNVAENKELDFTLVNQTGYGIKLLYIGPSNSPEWTDDMEMLKGKVFRSGNQMPIRFSSKAQTTKWDIMVKWTDGSQSAEWLGLDLSKIQKLTILYNADTDKTTYRIN